MASPNPLKRTYADANSQDKAQEVVRCVEVPLQLQISAHSSTGASTSGYDRARLVSPAPSSSSLSTLASPIKPPSSSVPSANSQKRTKLSHAEKEAQRLEKEAKKQRDAEERARKVEERQAIARQRAEEKAKREEEKRARLVKDEEKRKARELETKAKEEAKKLKQEEKDKKERSQLKLNAFFVQPKLPQDQSDELPIRGETSPWGSRRPSITSVQDSGGTSRDRSASAAPQKDLDAYGKQFPAFFLHSHTTLASWNRFNLDDDALKLARSQLDHTFHQGDDKASNEASERSSLSKLPLLLRLAPGHRQRYRKAHSTVKDIVAQIHGTPSNPIDLTASTSHHSNATQTPLELLKTVPLKVLKYVEDVRPPYIGTRTQLPEGMSPPKLGRRPCKRAVSSLVYDYDSEAEWEPLGEGEDLNSEGEDDVDDEDEEDDMKDFVVHEDAPEIKKRLLVTNQEHTSTGVCWEDAEGKSKTAIGDNSPCMDMQQYRLEIIADDPKLPIDPFSKAYWESTTKIKQAASSSMLGMDTLRMPLNTIDHINKNPPSLSPAADTKLPTHDSVTLPPKAPKRVTAKKFIELQYLEGFKEAVAGSDFNKNLLIEILKKQFPTQSKAAIQDTLNAVAERIGNKEANKRWVIKPEYVV